MKNKTSKKYFYQKLLQGILCTVIAVGSMLVFPQFGMRAEAAEDHNCSYVWTTLSEGSAYEDLYEIYSCKVCGEIKLRNYVRSSDYVWERLEKQIKGA